ncbi:uncharacterized protein LOC106163563 [Lingula anatina]|uniref:Uncharacterized protein LOC106163563 n=1 Tax=Lingula anatina TaxID=7574 RepID=A0A1S3IEI9_LINAN|nr:uncharacterized protein LOC106163563 [Lingula anatina]|eukprot:XP_013396647.1 uncharacterized protein LOC106163563 [Lingula anatina]
MKQAKIQKERGAVLVEKATEPPTKKLRSSSPAFTGSGHLWPDICVICKKKEKWITVRNNRERDRLMQAETVTAGNLTKSAELKNDESVLVHIRGKDCIAIKLKYHRKCFNTYTRHAGDKKMPAKPVKYQNSYKAFCNFVVKKRLIRRMELLQMSQLTSLFKAEIEKHADGDTSDIRNDKLKRWLMRDFPQLIFRKIQGNRSESVFVKELQPTDHLKHQKGSSGTSGSKSKGEAISTPQRRTAERNGGKLVSLFQAGMILKSCLKDTPDMTTPWHSFSCECTNAAAKEFIPNELYNLLSWAISASEEPTLDNLSLPEEVHTRLLSICQDIVHLASKGRKSTPKSLVQKDT